jgi:hypothetical protein
MPTIASSNVPTPKSWDEFEDIALAAAKLRWNSSDFYRNGRPGQKQDGVDIWGHDDDNRHIGVQCKNTVDGISLSTVKDEVANAGTFRPKLDRLYVATTAKRDAILQEAVREISGQRAKAGLFKVDVLFWDDICQDLAKNDEIFFRHYPQFRHGTDPITEHDKKLFDELISLLSSDGVIGFIDRHNMAGWLFEDAQLAPLSEFHARWNAPERRFVTPELEAARQALWSRAGDYLSVIAIETFPANTPGWRSVPSEWEEEQPERFDRVVKKLHALAGEIVDLHANLVHVGRKHLIGVPD